jgi:hypothetical protein
LKTLDQGGVIFDRPPVGGGHVLKTPGQGGVIFDRPPSEGGSCFEDPRSVDRSIDDHRSVIDRHHQLFEKVEIMFQHFQNVVSTFSKKLKMSIHVFNFFKKCFHFF